MSMRRGVVTALAVVSLTLGTAGGARALSLWTLTATPLTATAGQSTTFHMLALNELGPPAGCVNVEIPSSFVIQAAGNVVASDGSTWVAAIVGTWVEVTSVSGIDFLDPLESVSFDIRLLPTQAGTWTWNNHVHVSNQCTGTAYNGLPVTVVVAPAILPTPAPTPAPTIAPTPTPTALPSVLPTALPSVLPTALPSLLPTALPSLLPTALPSLLPTSTPEPTSAPTSTPDGAPLDQPASVGGGSGSSGGSGPVRLASTPDGGTGSIGLGTEVLGLLDGQLMWFVPGAVVGVPGLLVLLWIALQTIGALAWIPAVRRMGGGEPLATRHRRRRPARV